VTEALTLIGFDYGNKRIGVAVGQTVTGTATPLETIACVDGKPDWSRISRLIEQWHPQALVVGDPLNMDGTDQEVSINADKFSDELTRRFPLPVYRTDERLSSYEAKQRLKSTRDLDPVAAQAILETWLAEYSANPGRDATIRPSTSNSEPK
jgi:putative Holliday junction resolvase